MKKIKKPVSLLLSMILIFSLFTIIPVSAAETGQTRALCCVCPAVLYLDFAVFFFVVVDFAFVVFFGFSSWAFDSIVFFLGSYFGNGVWF